MKIAAWGLTSLVLSLAACTSQPPKTASTKQYPLTGKILSIDSKERTANIDAAAIPGFMDAMRMDYPISSSSDLSALHVGEDISATVNVNDDGSYTLSNIHESSAGK